MMLFPYLGKLDATRREHSRPPHVSKSVCQKGMMFDPGLSKDLQVGSWWWMLMCKITACQAHACLDHAFGPPKILDRTCRSFGGIEQSRDLNTEWAFWPNPKIGTVIVPRARVNICKVLPHDQQRRGGLWHDGQSFVPWLAYGNMLGNPFVLSLE